MDTSDRAELTRPPAADASLKLHEASYHGVSHDKPPVGSAKTPGLSDFSITDGTSIVVHGAPGNRIISERKPGPNSSQMQEVDAQGNVIFVDRIGATKDSPNTAVFVKTGHPDGSATLAYSVTEPGGRVFPSVDTHHTDGTFTNVDFDGRTGRPKMVTDEARHSVVDFDPLTGRPSQVTLEERDGHSKHFRIDPITHKAVAEPLLDFIAAPTPKW